MIQYIYSKTRSQNDLPVHSNVLVSHIVIWSWECIPHYHYYKMTYQHIPHYHDHKMTYQYIPHYHDNDESHAGDEQDPI